MLALVITCVLAGEAPADAPDAAAASASTALDDDPAFVDGQKLYNSFEFEKASFRFRAAARATGHTPADAARARLWLGLALGQAGDDVSAREAFASALALDPAVHLPDDAPPTLRPIFDDAAHATPAPAPPKPKPAPVMAPPAPTLKLTSVVGAALAGVGLVVIGLGAAEGAAAQGQADDAAKQPFQDDAIAKFNTAKGSAALANGLMIVGGIAAAAGAVVVVAGPLVE